MKLSDEAFNNLTAVFDSSVSFSEESIRLFEYTIRTPYKAGASAAFYLMEKV